MALEFKKFLFVVKNIKTVFIFGATQMHVAFHAVHEYFAVASRKFAGHSFV